MAADDTDQLIYRLREAIIQLSSQYAAADPVSIGEVGGVGVALSEMIKRVGLEEASKLLGESPGTITAFQRPRGTVNRDTALHFAERLIAYLRRNGREGTRHEQASDVGQYSIADSRDVEDRRIDQGEIVALLAKDDDPPNDAPVALSLTGGAGKTFLASAVFGEGSSVVRPLRWAKVPHTPDLQALIKELESLLPKLIRYTKFTNLSPGEFGLTDGERAHLIELLETNLALLKAPMVEIGMLEAMRAGLENVGLKLAEKGTEYAALGLFMGASEQVGHFIASIF